MVSCVRSLLVVLLLLCMPSLARAGAIVQLVPENTGPYFGGESFGVDVMVNQDPAGDNIYLRLLQFDFNGSGAALGLDAFAFHYSASQQICTTAPSRCGDFHSESPDLDDLDGAIAETAYTGSGQDTLRQMRLRGDGTALLYGVLDITLPTAAGTYVLDALNAGAADPANEGAQIHFGFGGGDPLTSWTAGNGGIAGSALQLVVVPEPTPRALLGLGVLALVAMRARLRV